MSNQNLGKLKIITLKDLGIKKEKPEKVSSEGFAVSIRSLLQNWRQGTVGCKTRAEVSYSNKKPWKQKGTGRARAGSRRSPLWVGGGIIFGPQPRVRKLKVNKSLRKNLLSNILWNFLENNKVFSLDYTASQKPKTSQAYKLLKNLDLHEKKLNLLVDANDFVTQAEFSNIPNVKILLFDEFNTFNLTNADSLVLLSKDINLFKNMVLKWI